MTLSGCIGVAVAIPEECETSNINMAWAATRIKPEKYAHFVEKNIMPTKKDFLTERGEPNEVIPVSATEEMWIYKEESLWCGIAPVVLVPVPFVLPVCDGFDRITFVNDNVTHLLMKRIGGGSFTLPVGGPFTRCLQ
jgi:hypothetical protein